MEDLDSEIPGSQRVDLSDELPNKLSKREKWKRKFDFLLACIGFSVGLGNVWRFPYLCYKNGGGAFLLPYFISVLLGGIPIFFLEVALGQLMSRGGIEAWNICPIFKGIGIASTVILFFFCCYYNVILGWAFYYLYNSFTTVLPWSNCDNVWNTENCTAPGSMNSSNTSTNMSSQIDSVVEFWEYKVLSISNGIHDPGPVKGDLALCLFFSWIVVFGCIVKGIKSSGKVMYVTATSPYLFMFILLVRSATLPGSYDGLTYYLSPDWSRLSDCYVWVDAGTQIFFSYSISLGTLTSLGSFNERKHDAFRDCSIFALVNSCTSILAGFIIFTTLGYMSKLSNVPIEKVAESGPGLAFIAYPKALSTMPFAPFWSAIFFVMVILLGLDSQFVSMEGFITALWDIFPNRVALRFRRELFTGVCCFICFLIGLSMVTNGGMYVFQIFDYYSGSRIILVVAFFECVVIAYCYGGRKFTRDIQSMFNFPLKRVMLVMWAVISPAFVMIVFGISAAAYSTLTYTRATTKKEYKFPSGAIAFGWTMAFSSVICIPLYAIYRVATTSGTLRERVSILMIPQFPEPESKDPTTYELSESQQLTSKLSPPE